MEKQITLTANGTPLTFNVTTEAYDKYLNELAPDKKTAPARNLLIRTVDKDCKLALVDLLDIPSMGVQLAAAVIDKFTPDVTIEVGE